MTSLELIKGGDGVEELARLFEPHELFVAMRRRHGLTQGQVVAASGIGSKTPHGLDTYVSELSRWERGRLGGTRADTVHEWAWEALHKLIAVSTASTAADSEGQE